MEYGGESDLSKFIKQYKDINSFIDEKIIANIIIQICLALKEIHKNNLIHRDLTPDNIFIDNNNNIKIGDFGVSKILTETRNYTQSQVGKEHYFAPEIVKGQKYNNKVDIYSLGCIIYELFTLNEYYIDTKYDHKNGFINLDIYNPKWQNLINLALEDDYNKRADIEKIYKYIINDILIDLKDLNIKNKENKENEIICVYNKKNKEPINLLFDYKPDCKEEYVTLFEKAKENINEDNLEIYVNNKRIKFNHKYENNEIGLIEIKYKFNKLLTSTSFMFSNCESLKSIDLSSLNINNITDMCYMFNNCHNLESIDLSSFNINKDININGILNHCHSLKLIKLSTFNRNNVIDINKIFNYDNSFKLEEKHKSQNILKENFIIGKNINIYIELSNMIENMLNNTKNELYMDMINNNFDIFYFILINNYIINIYSTEKNKYIQYMESIYNSTIKYIKLEEEGKKLYKYLMNYKLLEKKVLKKISEDSPKKEEFEILIYSLRFILNTQILSKKCFYNDILSKDSKNLIETNYIPGSFPKYNEFIKSYEILKKELHKEKNNGFYICKDCGYLYKILPSTFPMSKYYCPNDHIIGGEDHICYKKDLRIFETQEDYDKFAFMKNSEWLDSFQKLTLSEFKIKYVDKQKNNIEKGIIKDYDKNEFENQSFVRDMHNITYRFMNYLLYSYILGCYILDNINDKNIEEYLVKDLYPQTLFSIIKKNWELLSVNLKETKIESINKFLNAILGEIIEIISEYNSFDTVKKMLEIENKINKLILEKISTIRSE